jgi:hypothetical protein
MIPTVINITSAELISEYQIRLVFDDGTQHEVNFKPFLSASAHPDIRAWLDPQRFSSFRIEYGELVWGDYALCFPVADLYHNRIGTPSLLEAA